MELDESIRIPQLPECTCDPDNRAPCSASKNHRCLCSSGKFCRTSRNPYHTCICNSSFGNYCQAIEHECSCQRDRVQCKSGGSSDGKHRCSCSKDPLGCLAERHSCVCRLQWYDSWQRVCRAVPASEHDCTCRYKGLTCRTSEH